MLSQTLRSHKHSAGLAASVGSAQASEFHLVRVQETERARLAQDIGPSDDAAASGRSYFVPSLQSICAELLAQNFTAMPEIDSLRGEHGELYEFVVERLPVTRPLRDAPHDRRQTLLLPPAADARTPAAVPANASTGTSAQPRSVAAAAPLPLSVAVSRVVSEVYWKRCCLARWSTGQLSTFAGGSRPLLEKQYGWKRLFLEHVLSDFLMSLRGGGGSGANSNSSTASSGMAKAGHPQGRTRTIGAPAFLSADDDRGSDDFEPSYLSHEDSRALAELCAICRDYVHTVDLPCQYTHLDWYESLFAQIPGILNFRLTHGTRGAGVGYAKGMLGFTDADAESMRLLLSKYASLEALRLPQNGLRSRHALMMAAGLVGNTRLRILDLSRNNIDDAAVVEGLALLLCQPEFPLEELNLNDNNITGKGAAALAEALATNRTLVALSLGQNRIEDSTGGAPLICALRENLQSPLRALDLGSNLLAGETVAALRDVLPGLTSLVSLTLAGNRRIGAGAPWRLAGSSENGDHDGNATASALLGANDGRDDDAGNMLCEAVLANNSLQFIDVRFCGLTTEQVSTIEAAVQGRVDRVWADERAAKEEEQSARIDSAVASRPRGRST